jgi:hypothetical protein
MTKSAAVWYFSDEIIAGAKVLYSAYLLVRTVTAKSYTQDFFITQLNKKEIKCPACLVFQGWVDSSDIGETQESEN